jgi:hypothetical protein
MDDRDEEPVVIYHSHTATEAYPSRTDISYASEPGAHYVLVSTRSRTAPSSGRSVSWTVRCARKKYGSPERTARGGPGGDGMIPPARRLNPAISRTQ